MRKGKVKPQGASGPISMGGEGAVWKVIPFPGPKAEREELIANLFVGGFAGYVANQSQPSLAPFGPPKANQECDLDFTIDTAQGEKLMELAEFAPLDAHGPRFTDAPPSLDPKTKADLALQLIQNKSSHQGGENRFLVLYVTEHGFWLDPITIERLRRALSGRPPRFDRVYYVSPHDLNSASVTEIHPGVPHHMFGGQTDAELDGGRVFMPHPTELVRGHVWHMSGHLGINGQPVPATVKIEVWGIHRIVRAPDHR